MSEQKRGRGRPRNDGKPNKSTAALLANGADAKPILGKQPKPPVDEAAIGPNQAQRIQDAFRQEAELPVFEDRQAPPPLKQTSASRPTSVSLTDFLKSINQR